MRNARVKAINLKVGDVIGGQRVNHTPFVHRNSVHLFLSNHGKIEAAKFKADDDVSVKRPLYNLTRKPKATLRAKGEAVVAEHIAPTAVEAAVQRAEAAAGISDGFDGELDRMGGYLTDCSGL
jgi:hypothetical protein